MENVRVRYTPQSGTKFIGVTFLYMFIDLLITAAITVGLGYLFRSLFPISQEGIISEQFFPVYMGIMIGSFVSLLIISIWFSFSAVRGGKSLIIPFILYAVIFGVLCSSFTMFILPATIGLAFAMTCLAFGSMALIGYFARGNLSFLLVVVFGLLIGASLISLTNLIWMLVARASFQMFFWIVEFAIFGAVMLITIIDVWNIKKIAERGEANNNLALFCAFNLYTDFINIFLRILVILVRARGN